MATNTELDFLGRTGTERIVAKVKALLSNKQDKGDYVSTDDLNTSIGALGVVSYNTQSLTDSQKTQARKNIGITGTGADGKTPVRGTDYWTDEDKAEIKSYVDEAILGGVW